MKKQKQKTIKISDWKRQHHSSLSDLKIFFEKIKKYKYENIKEIVKLYISLTSELELNVKKINMARLRNLAWRKIRENEHVGRIMCPCSASTSDIIK